MKRLIDDSIAPELTELLRSAEVDGPPVPKQRERRIIAAMASAALASSALAASARSGVFWRAAKWSAPACGVLVAISAAHLSSSTDVFEETKSAVAPTAATEEAPAPRAMAVRERRELSTREESSVREEPSAREAAADLAVRVEDLPKAASKAKARVVAHPGPERTSGPSVRRAEASPSSPEPNLDAEIAAIDATRAALAEGRSTEALARVHDYRSNFAVEHFADEADALEVQALAALKRTEEARRKAEQFLAAHAQSPYARRVRAAVTPRD